MATKKRSEWVADAEAAVESGDYTRANTIYEALGMPTVEQPAKQEDFDVQAAVEETRAINPGLDAAADTADFAIDTLSNLPGSVGGVVKSTAEALLNPVDTAKSLMGLAQGGADWLGRQAIEARTGREYAPTEDEEALGRLGDYYADRYGGRENVLETIRTDPAGAMMDIPLPVGAATGVVSRVNPIRGAGAATRRALEPMARAARRRDFVSDMKPSTTLTKKKRKELVDTAMDEGIEASPAGYEKLQGRLADANRAVDERVALMEGDIDALQPLYNLERNRRRARSNMATGTEDLAKINEVEARLLENLARRDTSTMSPMEMNRYKRDLYRDIDWKDPAKTAENEALVSVARGAREAIEGVDPRIGPENARLGRLIDLEEHLLRGSNRMENRHGPWWQWGGVTPLAVAAGRSLERNAPGIPRTLADNPAVGALSEAAWLNQAADPNREGDVPILYPAKP